MKIMLEEGAFTPTRAHKTDAGLDIYAIEDGVVKAGQSATFGTGVHVEIPRCTAGILLPKSGLMIRHDILTFGVIDDGYTGEIRVHVFNHGTTDYHIRRGDRISQLLIVTVMYESVEIVDELTPTDRGASGFGSTGR